MAGWESTEFIPASRTNARKTAACGGLERSGYEQDWFLASCVEKHAQAHPDKAIGVGEPGLGPLVVKAGHFGEESMLEIGAFEEQVQELGDTQVEIAIDGIAVLQLASKAAHRPLTVNLIVAKTGVEGYPI